MVQMIQNSIDLDISTEQFLADTFTPVSLYYAIRDIFPCSLLLESSDYHSKEDSKSYICCEPIATFKLHQNSIFTSLPNGQKSIQPIAENIQVLDQLQSFLGSFTCSNSIQVPGLFGYMSFESVRHFEDISFDSVDDSIPLLQYSLYKYTVEIDHFRNTAQMHTIEEATDLRTNRKQEILDAMVSANFQEFPFSLTGDEESLISDEHFLAMIQKGLHHCKRGDVFQVVLSRRYQQRFKGDDFNVYRALRSINPSPYLFYFDYGSFKLMGSSPEAQIKIEDGQAMIYPIAGTYRKTGIKDVDDLAIINLLKDEKENAEHIMLVDLARNDLSRKCDQVEVMVYKEVQQYSHVIHLVSKVKGILSESKGSLQLVGDTFPAGTLSGAPKYRALEIIRDEEPHPRGFYGGAVGFLGLDGQFNHAIMIRSLMSQSNTLYYQAGAGIVAASNPASELQEVHNKLGAIRSAIKLGREL